MIRSTVFAIAAAFALIAAGDGAYARGGGHSGGHSASQSSGASHARAPSSVARDSHGRIARSRAATDSFKHSNPCPSTGSSSGACPGYVIDHVTALKRGGADDPSNMQWQTIEASKAKDKVE